MISKFGVLVIAVFASTVNALPPCTCTRNLQPVCGTDGKTYSNPCVLECSRLSNKDLEVAKDGPCDPKDVQRVCICTADYTPVCGVNGVTYSNRCDAGCAEVEVAREGECADAVKVVTIPPCTCTKEKKPVCGSDGKTYSNDCLLNCATAADSTLSVAHFGACDDDKVKVVDGPATNSPCTCTRNLQPVCGADGVTYANDCLRKCAGKDAVHEGPCEDQN